MSALIAEISSPVYPEPEARVLPASQLVKEAERLRKGDMVKVQRSNGAIEEGWEIVGFNPLTGDARVTRKEGAQILKKEISQSQLQSLNPVREETTLHNAQDFMQLFKAIDAAGNIQGHSQVYDPAQLKHLINQVRSGKEPIDVITRVEGIRQKVAELIAADKIRRSL
ncbi:MAG TPA: hypothetical protein VJH96_00785 [Patescibacteria group bacterium]|nr:hypothetical protein [Patescibacteria group bacterium]